MMKNTRYVGLDVHGETIAAAVGEGHGKARSLGQFPNRPESVRRFVEQLGGPEGLKICYEAGPTGYALYWQLTKMGIDCEVVAPVADSAGSPADKIKTDRRDAEEAGAVLPERDVDAGVGSRRALHGQALRDLVRARGGEEGRESGETSSDEVPA